TPIDNNIKLYKNKEQATKEEVLKYQQEIGALIYLALKTRIDITLPVITCSRYISNPSKEHF
ncbi:uncharacterized protein LY79DRAFT_478109, partial [Colletotrichum navitas]